MSLNDFTVATKWLNGWAIYEVIDQLNYYPYFLGGNQHKDSVSKDIPKWVT